MATPKKPDAEKTRKGPDYGLKPATVSDAPVQDGVTPDLSMILLPNPTRTRVEHRTQLQENLLALQEQPGVPFEVVHYAARPGTEENPSGARKIVSRILLPAGDKNRIALPPSSNEAVSGYYDVEWRDAAYDGGERTGSVVIAMWVVESDEAPGAPE